jgi:hypothetical protein
MNERIIVSGLNQFNWELRFVSNLKKMFNWDIVFWEVEKNSAILANQLMPDANIIISKQSKKKRVEEFNKFNWPLIDEDIIQEMTKYELILWPSFLRNTQLSGIRGDISIKDEYHRAITFRYYFMKEFMPDLYFYGNVPTGFYPYVDYLICKELGIKTILLRRIELPGFFAMPITSMIDHSLYIKKMMKSLKESKKVEIIKDNKVREYVESLSKDYSSAMPEEYGRIGGFKGAYKLDKNSGKLKSRKSWLFEVFKEMPRENLSRFKFFGKAIFYVIYRKNLQKEYNKLLVEANPKKEKYILVNLHYQPEASSIPLGGMCAYQEIMISMLSRAIPKGWFVYVKEHPTHLMNNRIISSLKFRHKAFYENLSDYRNVKLISVSENNFELIDSAQAVATLTGTSGFEALNRGVVCLAFGYPWYMYADGCLKISSMDELNNAIEKIVGGYHPSRNKIYKFVNTVLENSIKGMFLQSDGDIKNNDSENQYGKNQAIRFKEIISKIETI